MNAAKEILNCDEQSIEQFRPLDPAERWLASIPFTMAGFFVGSSSFMLAAKLTLEALGKTFEFDASQNLLEFCFNNPFGLFCAFIGASIPLGLAAISGMRVGRRVFRGLSNRWQVLAYRMVMLFFVAFLALFLVSDLIIFLFAIRGSTGEFVVFLGVFLLASIPLCFLSWRATHKQLATRATGTAAEIWRLTGV